MADLTPNITTNASGPISGSSDGLAAANHPLDAQIRADQYLKLAAAVGNRSRGLRYSKIMLGGQISGIGALPSGGFDNNS